MIIPTHSLVNAKLFRSINARYKNSSLKKPALHELLILPKRRLRDEAGLLNQSVFLIDLNGLRQGINDFGRHLLDILRVPVSSSVPNNEQFVENVINSFQSIQDFDCKLNTLKAELLKAADILTQIEDGAANCQNGDDIYKLQQTLILGIQKPIVNSQFVKDVVEHPLLNDGKPDSPYWREFKEVNELWNARANATYSLLMQRLEEIQQQSSQ